MCLKKKPSLNKLTANNNKALWFHVKYIELWNSLSVLTCCCLCGQRSVVALHVQDVCLCFRGWRWKHQLWISVNTIFFYCQVFLYWCRDQSELSTSSRNGVVPRQAKTALRVLSTICFLAGRSLSLWDYKAVKRVAKGCCPFVQCFKRCKPPVEPCIFFCSSFRSHHRGTKANSVVTP